MRIFLLLLSSCALISCGIREDEKVRRPVPPRGSDNSTIPWNAPQAGEGQGVLGGLLQR